MARVLLHASHQVRNLEILLSVAQEPNRRYECTWDGLNVQVQKSIMLRRAWKHKLGFEDELYVHFPYDTISRLRRIRPNIILSYELGFRSLASWFYAKSHGAKLALCVCVSEHTEQGRGVIRYGLRKWLLRQANAVTYNGPSCRRYLEKLGVDTDKLHYFPYATSDQFQYLGPTTRQPQDDHRLLYIGQLSDRKGIMLLLSGLGEYCLRQPDRKLHLTIIGTGDREPNIRALPIPHNLNVRMLGHLNYEQICSEMSQHGALIFPTLADEWGLVVNEALQAGLPVIGSVYSQAVTTLIEENLNGWQFTPDQSETLFHALDQFFAHDNQSLEPLREAAQKTVKDITSPNVANLLVDMFRQLQ